jgi:glucose/arabinose dehydrogenase
MRALRVIICLGLMGVFATATCDGDNSDDKRSGQGKGGPQEPPQSGGGATGIGLDLIAEGLTSPVALMAAPDSSGRLFIVDQIGVVRVVTNDGKLQDEPFLDVRALIAPIMPAYDERGLLGLAFHPYFGENGRLFVFYTAPPRVEGWDNTSVVAEYHVAPGKPGEKAQPVALLLQEDHPQFNHDGGTLAFGPDGHLYVSIGDGGGRDDEGDGEPQQTPVFGHVEDWYPANPGGNGQDIKANLMGNVLRLDVSTPGTYKIPADNPFVGRGKGEIWAYGFRNPYRFSFDIRSGDLLLGDAGQDMWEEIDLVRKGGNYGWNVKEGSHCFSAEQPSTVPASCPSVDPTTGEALIDPVIEMFNLANPMRGSAEGILTVIGGHVYRGTTLPQLDGRYVFGAFSTQGFDMPPAGAVYTASRGSGGGQWAFEKVTFADRPNGALGHYLHGFGQDLTGEVYVLTTDNLGPTGTTGRVYRLASRAAQ